jgi:hypothetical protein
VELTAVSPLYETEPMGIKDQGPSSLSPWPRLRLTSSTPAQA